MQSLVLKDNVLKSRTKYSLTFMNYAFKNANSRLWQTSFEYQRKRQLVVSFLHPHMSQSLKHAVSPSSKQG